MVENKTISIAVILGLVLVGGIVVIEPFNQDNLDGAYYCESRSIVMDCDKLSSGIGTRCYFDDTYKKCTEGWIEIESGMILQNETLSNIGLKFVCNSNECIEVK